ncbi:MAG: pyruvate kinase [Parasporobacterium sp.]|nr:pyruvate kinase [Parasporobacterium sp.]
MRKTKIICTIGPASNQPEVLEKMIAAGMDVARLNFSHGTHESMQETINTIKAVREKLKAPIPIMLDTKGPEYRVGLFEHDKVTLKEGQSFVLTTENVVGTEERVSVSYENLINELEIGDRILVNDGLIELIVEEKSGTEARCQVVCGGVLSNRKSMNFPGKLMQNDFLSEKDKEDLLFGIRNEVDYVAASFVSTRENVLDMRRFLDDNGGSELSIIAKIENRAGVENLDDILDIASGIMVARGDLGVEIPFIEVPSIQKDMTFRCRIKGKRIVTATEMLESMITKPRPTRAEVSDVANAVYEGTSLIMLSGETANGAHPVEAVKAMASIAEYTESTINYGQWFHSTEYKIKNNLDAICHATCAMANDVGAKCIVVNSITGHTAKMVSRFRCPSPIIGATMDERVWRRLNISWGVKPVLTERCRSREEMFEKGLAAAVREMGLKPGDRVVMTGGLLNGEPGNTDEIKIATV